jgi:hypothetical protein
MRPRAWHRALSALLAPLVLSTSAASAYSLYRCQYDEVTRRVCCCPHETARDVGERPPALRRASCCDVAHHDPAHVVSEPVPKPSGGEAPPVALFSPPVQASGPVVGALPRASDAEPSGARPTLLALKRSLLI